MSETIFNPFEDRLSRDIRNSLSEKFVETVNSGNADELDRLITQYLKEVSAPCYSNYISVRQDKYDQALSMVSKVDNDPVTYAIILWNLQLFFEVHEILEHAWYSAEGSYKETLQALIRSAGVYIKKEYGFDDSALRIAAKAIPVLEANYDFLAEYFRPQLLIDHLKNVGENPTPPQLIK